MAALAGTALAQEFPETANLFTIDLTTGLEFSDNPDLLPAGGDSRLISRTSLTFGLERRTGIDRLYIGLGGDILLGEDTDEIENPELELTWDRDVGHAQLGIEARVTQTSLDSVEFLTGEGTDSVDFATVDGGTRTTSRAGISGAFGVGEPVGGSYSFSHDRIRYSGTTDASLRDADVTTFSAALTTEVSPRATLGLTLFQSDFDEGGIGQLDTLTRRAGVSLQTELNKTLTGRFELGWQRVEQRGATVSNEEGVFVDANLTWTLPRGTFAVDLDSVVDANGRRNTLQATRTLDLPRGDLRYSLGVTRADGFDARPIYGLGWGQDMPRGRLSVDLTQTPTTSRENAETINSALSINYAQQLTNTSALDMTFSVRDSDELLAGGTDTRRYGVEVSYRLDMSYDWDMIGRLSSVWIEDSGAANRRSHTLFIGLEKRFGWN